MSEQPTAARITEHEIKPIDWTRVKFPRVDLEPVREIAEQTLLTGIGLGVLVARGVRKAVQAAYEAGRSEAEHPGSAAAAIASLVRPRNVEPQAKPVIRKVPVLPIADYNDLSEAELISRLTGLDKGQLELVRAYEQQHQNRPALLAAIQTRLQDA